MITLHSAGLVQLSSHVFELITPSDLIVEFSEIDSVAAILNGVNCSLKGKLINDIVNNQFYGILNVLFLTDFVYLTQDCISVREDDRGFDRHSPTILRHAPRDNHINGSDKWRMLPTLCRNGFHIEA